MGRPLLTAAPHRAARAAAKPKLKVWVTFGTRVKFGEGRARLLELIDELGSVRQAVDRFGMSYRGAWGYFRELERVAGFRLLEQAPEGPRGGTRLTREGRAFLARYRRFRNGLDEVVDRRFRRSFAPRRHSGRASP